MKTKLLLAAMLLTLCLNKAFSQVNDASFTAPQTWMTDPCGNLMMLPTLDYNEFIKYGGTAYSSCGIVENSLSNYYYTYYDDFIKSVIIETVYDIQDSCGNTLTCTDYYSYHPMVYIPGDIHLNYNCQFIEEIDSLTGLPYSEWNNQITSDQFISAGGYLNNVCDMQQPDIQVEYYDWNTQFNENGLPESFIRTFTIFNYFNGLGYNIDQQIVFNDPNPVTSSIKIIPPYNTSFDECNKEQIIPIMDYSEFLMWGGKVISECPVDENRFMAYTEAFYDEFWDKFMVGTYYHAEDNCGNFYDYEDFYLKEPFFTIPDDIYTSPTDSSFANIEELTTLPLSLQSKSITTEQFISAGGSFLDTCEINGYSNIQIDYYDYYSYPYLCPISINRVYTITDDVGILYTKEQQIVIEDKEAPVLQLPDETVLSCSDELPEAFLSFEALEQAGGTAYDNGILMKHSFKLSSETIDGTCPQTVSRTYEIQDTCGNIAYATQLFIINDTLAPVMAGLDKFVECSGEIPPYYNSYEQFVADGGTIDDNCGLDETTFRLAESTSSGSCTKEIKRTYEIIDACGNVGYFIQTIQVIDTIKPTISGIPDTAYVTCRSDVPPPFDYFSFLEAGGNITDNCNVNHSSFRFTDELITGSCPTIINRIYEVEDSCGNIGSWQHQIIVNDTIPPLFLTLPRSLEDIAFGTDFPLFEELEYTDNCGTPELTTTILPYTVSENGYPVTYLWTVTDSCGNSVETSTTFNVLPKPIEYCTSSGNASNGWIKEVKIGDQVNSSGSAGYEDFTDFTFSLTSSASYTITLTPGFPKKATFEYWAVWIDFNTDGVFTTDEKIFTANKKRSAISGEIAIPNIGNVETRMRVAMSSDGSPLSCGNIGYGEVEDYTVVISAAIPMAPVAALSSDKTTINVGETVQFYDESLNNPTSWGWDLLGADIGISQQQNPVATYNTSGIFNVILWVSNAAGSDSIVMFNYITVKDSLTNYYCESQSLSIQKEWIDAVYLRDIANTSEGSAYSDFTSISTSLSAGTTETIQLSPGFSNKSQREFWKVWIDFNQDKDFDDAGEEVLSVSNAKSAISGNIQIPANALPGSTRMRVSMKANSFVSTCEIFDRGEVEDYSVTITSNKNAFVTVQDEAENTELIIYPNPAHNYLTIKHNMQSKNTLTIFNAYGAVVKKEPLTTNLQEIDIRNLAPGSYYIKINGEGYSAIRKFIKQ